MCSLLSYKPSSVALKDEVVKAHRGVERQFVIYCFEINYLLLKVPPCTDYGNSVAGRVIDGEKVALINCFVCQANLFFSLFLSEMINNELSEAIICNVEHKARRVILWKTYLLD